MAKSRLSKLNNKVVLKKRTKKEIAADKSVKAKHPGKRESASGETYYENRPNRSDRNRTKKLGAGGKPIGSTGLFDKGGDINGWEKQKEWHGNPSLGYQSYKKMFALPSGHSKVPVFVFGTPENGWSYVVSAGASSDYSYTGGFPVDVRNNDDVSVVLKYADDLYKHGKMIFKEGGKPIGSTGLFAKGGKSSGDRHKYYVETYRTEESYKKGEISTGDYKSVSWEEAKKKQDKAVDSNIFYASVIRAKKDDREVSVAFNEDYKKLSSYKGGGVPAPTRKSIATGKPIGKIGSIGKGGKRFAKGGKANEPELLLDSNRGVYIPKQFVENYNLKDFGFNDEQIADYKKELSSPDNEFYWETWDELLSNAKTKDGWTLDQNEDLWLVPPDFEGFDSYKGGGVPAATRKAVAAPVKAVVKIGSIGKGSRRFAGGGELSDKPAESGWFGTDRSLEESLHEYGFVMEAMKGKKDMSDDEYKVLYKVSDNRYDVSYISVKDMDAIIKGDEWASEDDIQGFLESMGHGETKNDWFELPPQHKLSDLLSYWGHENILGSSYGGFPKKEADEMIGITDDSDDNLLEFIIPTWAMSALVNDDRSGLEDEDEKKLDKFIDKIVKKYGNAHFMLGTSEDEGGEGAYFSHRNDIDGYLGADVEKMFLRADKGFAAGGKPMGSTGLFNKGGKTVSVQVYSFDELSDKAKNKALHELSDINFIGDWWESTYEDAERSHIHITSFDVDRREIDGEFIGFQNGAGVAKAIMEDHGKTTPTYKLAAQYLKDVKKIKDEDDESDLEEKFRKAILKEYLNILDADLQYRASHEAIIETIEANEYEFLEDGRLRNFAVGGVTEKPIGSTGLFAKGGKAGYKKFREGVKVKVDEAYLNDEASGGNATSVATVISEPSDEEELVQIQYENGIIDYLGQQWLEPIKSMAAGGKPIGSTGLFEEGGTTKPDYDNPAKYDDHIYAEEIELYGENNSNLYRQRWVPILKNLKKKKDKGVFDVEKAAKLVQYWVEDADKRYQKEILGREPSGYLLSVKDRKLLSRRIAEHISHMSDADMSFDKGGAVKANRINTMLDHYIAAALWSSIDDNDEPMDANYSKSDLDPKTLAGMKADVQKFVEDNEADIKETGLSDTQIAHTFWLARHHHGSGWFDFSLDQDLEDRLTKATHAFRETDLYVGDDKNIHGSGYYENGGRVMTVDLPNEFAGGGIARVTNAESNHYAENRIPFKGNNLEGKLLDNGDYAVLSYGYYPIWFWCKGDSKWYGNSDKYSRTTSKQMTQSRPSWEATMLSNADLLAKMGEGQGESMGEETRHDLGGVMIRTLNPMTTDNTLGAHAGNPSLSQDAI